MRIFDSTFWRESLSNLVELLPRPRIRSKITSRVKVFDKFSQIRLFIKRVQTFSSPDRWYLRNLLIYHAKVYPFLSFDECMDKFHFVFFKGSLQRILFLLGAFRMSYFIYGALFHSQWKDTAEMSAVFWGMISLFVSFFALASLICSAAAFFSARELDHVVQTFLDLDEISFSRWPDNFNGILSKMKKWKKAPNKNGHAPHFSLLDTEKYRTFKCTHALMCVLFAVAIILSICIYFYFVAINSNALISPLEFCFGDPEFGSLCLFAEIVYTVPTIVFAAMSVVIYGIIFATIAIGCMAFLNALSSELNAEGLTIRQLENIMEVYTFCMRFDMLLNDALMTLLIPFIQVGPVSCCVMLNWIFVRTVFQDGITRLYDFMIVAFCTVTVFCLTSTVLLIMSNVNRISKQSAGIIKDMELRRRELLARTVTDDMVHRLKTLKAELKAARPFTIVNIIDGPITPMADVNYLMHFMDYTVNALLFFQ